MSTKPIPVALTAAYLFACYIRATKTSPRLDCMDYMPEPEDSISAHTVASLASSLHRLLPALRKSSVAQCNGEEYDGQRDNFPYGHPKHQEVEARIAKRAAQLTRRLAKLSEALKSYGLYAHWQTDPRGAPLYLVPIGEDDYSRGFCVGG